MLELLMLMTLTQGTLGTTTAQVQPCVWPNRCAAPAVVQIQTCQWPNKCSAPAVAQVQTCQWPNRCSQSPS